MIIRFSKGQTADAVIPTAHESAGANKAPGDTAWKLPADINPSKIVQETENVQATDPLTGAPLFDENGMPIWETTAITDPVTGEETTQTVTQQVPKTYTLMQRPGIFTPADIAEVAITYEVVN